MSILCWLRLALRKSDYDPQEVADEALAMLKEKLGVEDVEPTNGQNNGHG